jgi:type I restriction enzyme, S subunit
VMNDWPELALGDLIRVKHGFAFKSEYFTDRPQPTVLVTPGNFSIGGGFKINKSKYYDGPVPDDYVLRPGQVVVTMTDLSKESDTLGYAAIIPDDGTVWLHNQRVGLLEFEGDTPSDQRFVHYLLRTPGYRAWVVGSASGTTVKHTSPSRIESYRFRMPPLDEQRAIGQILGTIDEKIGLNWQANQSLEAIARAVFLDWFVDFGPIRAKSAGRQPYLAPGVWNLFPDRLATDGLPVGWMRMPLDQTASFLNGLPLQKFPPTGVALGREWRAAILWHQETCRTSTSSTMGTSSSLGRGHFCSGFGPVAKAH